ncbi:kelch domain-containing protein 2 isoform X1 [Nematostella vectensis]|uniref:kelch domain-containing protein 2 isoform X1 n=1 Tax=Nematostella vectensis TaxID=45351 RepID=UPI0020771B5E|nr:kelch domain-containing protein 2 isoform X1 [Nematostella vectensis]
MSFLYSDSSENTPEERSGHIAVYYNGHILVWGGYHDIEWYHDEDDIVMVDRYLSNYQLWLYNLETKSWCEKYGDLEDLIPPPLSGSCAICIGNKMYLFGGHTPSSGTSAEIFVLDLKSYIWQRITDDLEGEIQPSPRDKFGCWQHNDCIVYFGGYGVPPSLASRPPNKAGEFIMNTVDRLPDRRGWNNYVFMLDTEQMKWIIPEIKGDPPSPRAAFATAKIASRAYLFGGRFMDTRLNDLHYLDLDKWQWSGSLTTAGCVPEGRTWHSLTAVSDKHLFLYGGLNNNSDALGDAYILDTESLVWSQIPTDASLPSSKTVRMWHTACNTSTPGEVVIFGGSSKSILKYENPCHSKEVIIFRFSALPLSRLAGDAVLKYCRQMKSILKNLQSLPKHVLRSILSPAKLAELGLT